MTQTYNHALEWAAKWIEDTLKAGPETDERTIEFGTNMAMTLRAAKLSDADLPRATADYQRGLLDAAAIAEHHRKHYRDNKTQCVEHVSDTPTSAATAEIARLTSELKAVQERAASEISELAVAVTDLKFKLYNAGFEIEQLNAEVERLRNQRDSARANAINEALIAVEDLRKAYPESLRAYLRDIYSTWLSLRLSLSSKKNPVSKSER
jgi:hypothetical protein